MKVYAQHTSGRKLFYPTADALNCSTISRSEIAAITETSDGVTYPEATFYLLNRSGQPKAGWQRVTDLRKDAKNGHLLRVQKHENGSLLPATLRVMDSPTHGL